MSHTHAVIGKNRLEAFSDGVLAIIITIMVLEMKVPHGGEWANILPLVPVFLSYVLSFVYVAIYWNNHHHLLAAAHGVTPGIMWANMHLLFWLSLVPFVTGWLGENHFTPIPMLLYGIVMCCAAMAYFILQNVIVAHHPDPASLRQEFGRDTKGLVSLALCVTGIALALFYPRIAYAMYVAVALFWLVPDRRIERALRGTASNH